MKIIWKICKSILLLALLGVIVWTVLYFTVPTVKDWTNDKVLKIDQSKNDEEKKQLIAENEDLKKQIDSLTSQATTVSTELTTVKAELSEKKTALEKATAEKALLETKVGKLTSKVAELENSGSATSAELENKKQELATAQANLQTKTAEVETLTAEKTALENQKTALESQIQNLQARVEELETQLNPGEEGYTYEEICNFTGSERTGLKIFNNTYLFADGYAFKSSVWLQKNNKFIKLNFSSTDRDCYKFGDKDLFLDTKTSYLVDKNGNVEEINTADMFSNRFDYYNSYYSLQVIDKDSFFLIGEQKIKKVNLKTKTNEIFNIALNNKPRSIVYFPEENIIYFAHNSSYYIFNFNTNKETQCSVNFSSSQIIKVDNNKYLCGTNTLYLFDSANLTFTELKKSFDIETTYTHILNNGNVLIGTSNYPGLYLYNKETSTIEQVDAKVRGLYFIKTNSGKLFGTSGVSGITGIYIYQNDSLTKIYDSGYMWDTVVEDENGCTFSSKYDPSQGSVYYDYTTGTCNAVTE